MVRRQTRSSRARKNPPEDVISIAVDALEAGNLETCMSVLHELEDLFGNVHSAIMNSLTEEIWDVAWSDYNDRTEFPVIVEWNGTPPEAAFHVAEALVEVWQTANGYFTIDDLYVRRSLVAIAERGGWAFFPRNVATLELESLLSEDGNGYRDIRRFAQRDLLETGPGIGDLPSVITKGMVIPDKRFFWQFNGRLMRYWFGDAIDTAAELRVKQSEIFDAADDALPVLQWWRPEEEEEVDVPVGPHFQLNDGDIADEFIVINTPTNEQGTIADAAVDLFVEILEGYQSANPNTEWDLAPYDPSLDDDVVFVIGEDTYRLRRTVEAESRKFYQILRDSWNEPEEPEENAQFRRWGDILYVNEGDRTWTQNTYVLWFGAMSYERYLIYANSLDDAFDEGMDYIAELEPGLLANDAVKEEYQRLLAAYLDEHSLPESLLTDEIRWEIMEGAEVDTSQGGNASDHINSDEWGIIAEDPSPEELRQIATQRQGDTL